MPKLFSIIIPTFNEAENIEACLMALQLLRHQAEIILSDGGSDDDTLLLAKPLVDISINSAKGRAKQMNAGAKVAQAEILLFLHADTYLPDNALIDIQQGFKAGYQWGRFDISLQGLIIIATLMSWRSRLTSIATGDQVLFISHQYFDKVNGFADIALMEDITLCRHLKELSKPLCLRSKVISSARRWQQFGVIKTILLMWWLRLAYYFGANPEDLAELYKRGQFWKHSSG